MPDADKPEPSQQPTAAQSHDALLAHAIETLGSDRFPLALRKLIELCCGIDSMVITRYPAGAPPQSLYQDLDDVQAAISVQFYATGPYLLDPFYQACQDGVAPGAYLLFDLTAESFFRSEYYRTFYRKIRIGDEMGILIRQDEQTWILVSLARGIRQPRFTRADAAKVNAMQRSLSALVLKHWAADSFATPDAAAAMEDRLDGFAADILSPREAQIIRLILRGHSTPSAAAFLGIKEGTVKVHRHNAYSKLGVSSQAELFSMATQFLTSQQS